MVLISFVGNPNPGKYTPTRYEFGSGRQEEASFFGLALLTHLRNTGQMPIRWLLIGTQGSAWDAPAADLGGSCDPELERLRCEVKTAVADGKITQELANEWARVLSRQPGFPECLCCIVGKGDTPESQQELWRALDKGIPCGERAVTLDVTHGFRTWPILASFMLMFLRWRRPLHEVTLVYGTLGSGGEPGPTVRLQLCNQLLRAAEAVATYRYTGNYVPMAEQIWPEDRDFVKKIREIAYRADVQRLKPQHVKDLRLPPPPPGCPEETLAELLWEALPPGAVRASERMLRQAVDAMKHGHYLNAIVWLWEGLIVAAARVYDVGIQFADAAVRSKAEEELHKHHREVSLTVEKLRNAAVHGTDPMTGPFGKPVDSESARRASDAIRSPDGFRCVFEKGQRLLEELIEKEKKKG